MPHSPVTREASLSAFSDRAPLSAAWAWLDARPAPSAREMVPLAACAGRVLAEPVIINGEKSRRPRAVLNGYAVRSSDCDGAGAYNPLMLRLLEQGAPALAFATASPIVSGWSLPSGADAVLPLEAAQLADAGTLEVLAPVQPGTGIDRADWRDGTAVLDQGRRIGPLEVACLATLGIEHVAVSRRPRVAIVVPGAKSGPDALTPMLSALLDRDGALAGAIPVLGAGERALAAALSASRSGFDVVLIAGRGGAGPDDFAPLALQLAGGNLALHGLALCPGDASGLGTLPGDGTGLVPVVLLPGDPPACLAAYDMLAARLVRRLPGSATVLPYAVAEFELERKIVSVISVVEVVPVRLTAGRAVPIGAGGGLPRAACADGFVIVPETSEGYPEAARVGVHLYNTTRMEGSPDMRS